MEEKDTRFPFHYYPFPAVLLLDSDSHAFNLQLIKSRACQTTLLPFALNIKTWNETK